MKMKKIYCVKCNKYRKFESPKVIHIFNKRLIICGKCGSNDEKIIKEEESVIRDIQDCWLN